MGRMYGYMSGVYRISILVMVSLLLFWETEQITKNDVVMYLSFFIYVSIFTLFNSKKMFLYFEFFSILLLILYYEHAFLYFLMILPIIELVTKQSYKLDVVIFSAIFFVLGMIQGIEFSLLFVTTFAFLIAMSLFHFKLKYLEYLERRLSSEKKEKSQVRIDLSKRERELEHISRMFIASRELNKTINISELTAQLVTTSRNIFNAHYACVYLLEGNQYVRKVEDGSGERYGAPERMAPSPQLLAPLFDENILRIPIQFEGAEWGILAIYGKRIMIQNQMIAFPFQEEDYEIVIVYIEQVMFKMKHARILKKMHYLANNDPLTGIPNRRYFVDQLEFFIKRAKRGEDLAVLIIDVDFFKKFNDTYGHDVGDEVLKIVAETLQDCIREVDVVGRIGGEEFAILLPNHGGNPDQVAERIRKTISHIPFKQNITVSIGLSHYGEGGTKSSELLKSADKALYQAKNTGRNKVIVFGKTE